MTHWGRIVLVVVGLTGLAAALVSGHPPWAGPEIFGITESHGVNVGDLPVLAVWAASMAHCRWQWGRLRRAEG